MLMRTKTWRIVDQKSEYISDQSRKSSGIDMRDCEAGWQGMARSVRAQAKVEGGRQGRVEGGGKAEWREEARGQARVVKVRD